MYSGGIQLSARLRMDASCDEASRETSDRAGCFPWAGDTTAALFYDIAGGIRSSATPLGGIYDSRKPEDLALWPQGTSTPGNGPVPSGMKISAVTWCDGWLSKMTFSTR